MLALCPSSGKYKECQSLVKLSKVLQNKRTLCAVSAPTTGMARATYWLKKVFYFYLANMIDR